MNQPLSFGQKTANKEYLDDPPQPRNEDPIPGLQECRRMRGVRYFPPVVPESEKQIDILFVQISPIPEEASEVYVTAHNMEIPRKPGIGTGPAAQIIRESVNRFPALHESRIGFASLVPWLLPKTRRFKPSKEELAKCTPWLREKVREINPRCVVALGMPAFRALCDLNISQDDARYGWFATESGIPLYLSFPISKLITQPWTQDELITDIKEVNRMLETSDREGGRGSFSYQVVDTIAQLEELVTRWSAENRMCFSVDCEWGRGANHLTGDLRSIQFAWATNEAAYLRFYDEHNNRYLGGDVTFDEEGNDVYINNYRLVGEILNRHLGKEGITYIGHHFTADSPWMEHVLGIPVLGRCVLDTEYALQSIDEYAPRGLESIALRYTDFGRYDMDLVMWKKANPGATKEGYEKIPDEILIPYAVKDVLAVWRARDPIERRMKTDDVFNYYQSILNPFVTDVFHDFVTCGLPVNMQLFSALRVFMNWAYRVLLEDFKSAMSAQADDVVSEKTGVDHGTVASLRKVLGKLSIEEATARFTPLLTTAVDLAEPWFAHWHEIDKFNIRSAPMMRRWLFNVCGFTPIKTTKGGADGTPSMLWEKAMELPENIRKTLNPATDKETLEILEKDDKSGLISRLLAVSNVGNQCKGFLKEGDVDEATGEVVEEHGLAKFIAHDNRIHGQFSLTETGRPRSWSPNILNLSSYHNKGVEAGLLRVLAQRPELEIPNECAVLLGTREELEKKVADAVAVNADPEVTSADIRKKVIKDLIKTQIPTVRSIVCAEPNWCFVESDYKTAEIRGLAFIFGDRALIKLMTEPDPTFAFDKDWEPVRLSYADDCGIPLDKQSPSWVMTKGEEGKVTRKVDEAELQRDGEGKIIHPPYDLHWTLAEMVYKVPREELSSKRDRGAAKVANFSCWEDGLILSDKGVKRLTQISIDDKVWDGLEFVRHEGIVYQGIRLTIDSRFGRGTPDHQVFSAERERTSLLELALRDFRREVEALNADKACGNLGARAGSSANVFHRVGAEVCGPEVEDFVSEVSLHEAAVRGGDAHQYDELQAQRDKAADRIGPSVYCLGASELAGRGLQRQGFRSDQKQRSLLAGEPAFSGSFNEHPEYSHIQSGHQSKGGTLQEGLSGSHICGQDPMEPVPAASDSCSNSSEVSRRRQVSDPRGEAEERQSGLRPQAQGVQSGPTCFGEADLQAVSSGVFGLPGAGVLLEQAGLYDHVGNGGGGDEPAASRLLQENGAPPFEGGVVGSGDRRALELHQRETREVLIENARNRGSYGHLIDKWIELAAAEGFDGAAELAALEALGLKPMLEPVFDIADCGPRNRFVVLVPEDTSATIPPHEPQKEQNQLWSEPPGVPGFESGRVSSGIRRRGAGIHRRGGTGARSFPGSIGGSGGGVGSGSYPGAACGSGAGDQADLGRPVRPGAQSSRSGLQPENDPECDGGGNVAPAAEGAHRPLTPGFRQVIVSNCAYGAVAATIERRIEAVTGIKPAEGTGEALLAALEKRQPDVFRGLEEVADKPKYGERLRAASGRVRRFPVHDAGLGGVSWRVRNSYLRAMGNEARNFFPQESVAATLARACRWLNAWYRAEGLKARAIVGLYDSVVTYCPLEERFVCSEAHEVFMHRINFWKYGRRYMNYPIDTDLVERWSFKPSKALKAQLTSKDFVPMDAERQRGILERLAAREKMIFDAQPWVLKNLNKAEIST